MKKKSIILLVFVCLFLGLTSINAQKCKFAVDKDDPFTGKVLRITKLEIIPSLGYWLMGFVKDGDNYYIKMLKNCQGDLNFFVEKGDSVMFKFANDSVMTFYSKERVSPVTIADHYSSWPIQTNYEINYNNLTLEQLKFFSTTMVSFVKIFIGENNYVMELNEKKTNKLMQDAKCITQ